MTCHNAALIVAIACLPLSATACAQQATGTTTPTTSTLLKFAGKVRSCSAATHAQQHPLMPGFTIEHSVIGPQDGHCAYTQTMPGNMRMVCAFDAAARTAFADELKHTAETGQMSGSTSGAQPAWTGACEIETPSGKRIPFG